MMRVPRRRRARLRVVAAVPAVDLSEAAKRAVYSGSPEHKDVASFAGAPRPRADASICDSAFADKQIELTRWLRKAIQNGSVSEFTENGFPRYVWYQDGETVYEARLINSGSGEYKGYALNRDEWPGGMF